MLFAQLKPAIQACILFGAGLGIFDSRAQAGGSLLVDDAAVTPAGRCQLEAWARAYDPGQELTAVPACNHAGTEYSLGVSAFFHPRSGPLASVDLLIGHQSSLVGGSWFSTVGVSVPLP